MLRTFIVFLLTFTLAYAEAPSRSAHEVWLDMTEGHIDYGAKPIIVDGINNGLDEAIDTVNPSGNYVMFGGEKEGSSSLLTRVMSPNKEEFKEMVKALPEDKQVQFYREFLGGIKNKKITERSVKDINGIEKTFDTSNIRSANIDSLSHTQLESLFDGWLNQAGDRSFSFLKKGVRQKIFNGGFPGLSSNTGLKARQKVGGYGYHSGYKRWVPLYGNAQKYIDSVHGTSVGWEMNFIPQRTYGEFEQMIDYFRDELKNMGKRFEAPGHQWIVYPKADALRTGPNPVEASASVTKKLGEIYKTTQAYVVLKGIEGGSGIEVSNYKNVQDQSKWADLKHDTQRGVFRLENGRFKVDDVDSFAIEMRAGTKNDSIRRFVQRSIVSRYASADYRGIADVDEWVLNPSGQLDLTPATLRKRFGISPIEAKKFVEALENLTYENKGQTKKLNLAYAVPFWNWETAPFLSPNKREDIKKLTRTFIKTIANLENPNLESFRTAMQNWTKTSRLSYDIEDYLKPKLEPGKPLSELIKYPVRAGGVDVNKIDFGIEYSARFPLKTSAELASMPESGHVEWLKTNYDYDMTERNQTLRKAAAALSLELNGSPDHIERVYGDGHGHGLDIAYTIFDKKKNRKWKVEWDGVGRSYASDDTIIPDSIRGGHVEIVTPKFNPDPEDMEKLYKALDSQGIVPSTRFGGGHINIDLAPFQGKPDKMARFIGAYLENRNMMSLLFQDPRRLLGAEPNTASPELIQKLKNFSGTEDELKRLLYDEKFFNTRVGRKTKNMQLNLIAYFQDAIPEEFIHEDFDMKNQHWRRTFDVEPKIRKLEFRMFNAPRNATESALQIKFTKALMDRALNGSDDVFSDLKNVDYEAFVNNPEMAKTEFEKVMKRLGLDPNEYRAFFVEGMETSKLVQRTNGYEKMKAKLSIHPKIEDWKKSVKPRSARGAVASAGRVWNGEDLLPEAKLFKRILLERAMYREQVGDSLFKKGSLTRAYDTKQIDLDLTLDEIKKFDLENRAMSLYFKYGNRRNIPREAIQVIESTINEATTKGTLASLIKDSIETSGGFQRWLGKQLPQNWKWSKNNWYIPAHKELLRSEDSGARQIGIKFFEDHPKKADILLTAAQDIGENSEGVRELLKGLTPDELKAAANPGMTGKVTDYVRGIADNLIGGSTEKLALTPIDNYGDAIGRVAFNHASHADLTRKSLTLASILNRDDKWTVLRNTLDSTNKSVRDHVRGKAVKDYPGEVYWLGRDRVRTIASEMSNEDKLFFGKHAGEYRKILQQMSAADIKNLHPEGRLHVLFLKSEMPAGADTQKVNWKRLLLTNYNAEHIPGQIEKWNKDIRFQSFLTDYFFQSPHYLKYVKDEENVRHLSNVLFESKDKAQRLNALQILRDSPVVDLHPFLARNVNFIQGINVNALDEVFDELAKADPSFIEKLDDSQRENFFKYVERTLANNEISSEQRRKLTKILINGKEHPIFFKEIKKLAHAPHTNVRHVGILLLANTKGEKMERAIQELLDSNIPLSELNQKVIDRGRQAYHKWLLELKPSDIRAMSPREALYSAYKNATVLDGKNTNLEVHRKIFEGVRDSRIGALKILQGNENDRLFTKFLLETTTDLSFKKKGSNLHQDWEKAIVKHLTGPDSELRGIATKSVNNMENRPVAFLNKHLDTLLDNADFVKNHLDNLDIKTVHIQTLHGDATALYDNVLNRIVQAESEEIGKPLTRLLSHAPTPAFDTHVLKFIKAQERPIPQMLADNVLDLLKTRGSIEAIEALEYMESGASRETRTAINEVKRVRLAQAQNLQPKDIKSGRPIGETLADLYLKSRANGNIQDLPKYFKRIRGKEQFLKFFDRALDEHAPRFQAWILNSIQDKKIARALSLDQDALIKIFNKAIQSPDPGIRSQGLAMIKNNKAISQRNYLRALYANWNQKFDKDYVDALQHFAKTRKGDPYLADAVAKIYRDVDFVRNIPGNLKTPLSDLVRSLQQNAAERVFIAAHNNPVTPHKVMTQMFWDTEKHLSSKIARLAQQYHDSPNPELKEVSRSRTERFSVAIKKERIPAAIGRACESFTTILRSL